MTFMKTYDIMLNKELFKGQLALAKLTAGVRRFESFTNYCKKGKLSILLMHFRKKNCWSILDNSHLYIKSASMKER